MLGSGKSGFFTALIGGLLGGLIVALLLLFVLPNYLGMAFSQKANPKTLSSGQEIINNLRCPRGETKRIIMHGAMDDYAPAGHEPAQIHPRLLEYEILKHYAKTSRDYDEGGLDKMLYDNFAVPANISDGIFITRFKAADRGNNDTLVIGDEYDLDFDGSIMPRHTVRGRIKHLPDTPGWQRKSDGTHWLKFSEAKFNDISKNIRKISTLLEYVQMGQQINADETIVDLTIGDDTIVDYAALVVCQQPKHNKGLTLVEYIGFKNKLNDIAFLVCDADPTQQKCNPLVGDTLCTQSLPLACFNDQNLPEPEKITATKVLNGRWSGGEIAYTPPVRGDSFASIAQANAHCAQTFGKPWRVLSWHDGGGGENLARTQKRRPAQRSWVDIKDQPYGTCWTR